MSANVHDTATATIRDDNPDTAAGKNIKKHDFNKVDNQLPNAENMLIRNDCRG